MMKGFERDLNGDQRIRSLKQNSKHLRGKGLGNGVKTYPYKRHNERENEMERKIRSTVSLKQKAKHFKEEGFDKENNNREDKHQRYERKSRDKEISKREEDKHHRYERKSRVHQKNDDQKYINGPKRHQNDDGIKAGERSSESLKEKAKQLKDTDSHTPEVKHQNGPIHHKTNDEKDSGDEVIARLKEKAKQRRGRGFDNEINNREGVHRMLSSSPACDDDNNADAASNPQRSAEGWILFVTNITDEADEDDIQDKFCDYGTIMNLSMNVDRRTGFCKGYALVQFETYEDASSAKDALDGAEIMGQSIKVDWCFIRGVQRIQKLSENKRH